MSWRPFPTGLLLAPESTISLGRGARSSQGGAWRSQWLIFVFRLGVLGSILYFDVASFLYFVLGAILHLDFASFLYFVLGAILHLDFASFFLLRLVVLGSILYFDVASFVYFVLGQDEQHV